MSEAVTVLAQALAAQQVRPTTPTNQPVDIDAVKAWFAEQSGKPGTPMTPKEMARWDEKSRAAWMGVMA